MTIRDIAGFCPEEAIWKMMADVSEYILKDQVDYLLSPDSVMIDGNMFMVEAGQDCLREFMAPEQIDSHNSNEEGIIWSLGAVVYYMATGHVIFGGHGGSYQKYHPNVPLPILPKGLQALTPVIQRCLCYNLNERISMKDLNELSVKGLASCKQQRKKVVATEKKIDRKVNYNGEKWPEEMIEI